ncbi:hypothetical protein [Halovenus marina]|uniref:hypothetical protein n=1 Tax=Halovenus marina TaxID=3396621 RepID=UPI003F56F176
MADSSGDSPELLGAVENRLTDEGWRIDRTEVSPGVYQIAALDPETDQRRVLAVLPNPEATVRAEHCTWLAEQADETEADAAELVTAGRVPDDVADTAREHDVSILDPATFFHSADQPSAATDDPGAESPPGSKQAGGGAQTGAGQPPAEQPPGQPARGHGQSDPRQRTEPPQQGTAPPRNSRQEPTQPQNQQPPQGTAPQNQQTPPQNAQQGSAQPRDQQQHAAPPQNQHQNTAPPQNAQQGGISNWSSSRLLALGGGVLAGVSLFLPWVVSIEGSQSWNGMALEISVLVLIPVLLGVLLPALSWGTGLGRLSALVTLILGGLMVAGGFFLRTMLAETVTTGTIEIDGQTIPIAVVESAVGLDVFMLAGVLVAIGGLGGLFGSFQK